MMILSNHNCTGCQIVTNSKCRENLQKVRHPQDKPWQLHRWEKIVFSSKKYVQVGFAWPTHSLGGQMPQKPCLLSSRSTLPGGLLSNFHFIFLNICKVGIKSKFPRKMCPLLSPPNISLFNTWQTLVTLWLKVVISFDSSFLPPFHTFNSCNLWRLLDDPEKRSAMIARFTDSQVSL